MTATKIQNNKYANSNQESANFLDTLAEPPPANYGNDVTLRKRARRKNYTRMIAAQLMQLDSPLKKQYKRAYYCADMIEQVGTTLKSKYCNSRACNVCNSIRTAKLMNGYLPQIEGQQFFVTLTIPNVKADVLRETIKEMQRNCTNIQRNLREKKGLKNLSGIRKIEVTHNEERNDYHPHIHLMVNCEESAHQFVIQWLERYKNAKIQAQDIREADQESLNELFKYTTKIGERIEGKQEIRINIKALDVIMQATNKLRIFQPFGNLRKAISEDITPEDLKGQSYNIPDKEYEVFLWRKFDWNNVNTSEPLTYSKEPIYKIIDTSLSLIYNPPDF